MYNELYKRNEVERELRELVERSKADCAELVKEVDRREDELQSLQRSFDASLSDKRLAEQKEREGKEMLIQLQRHCKEKEDELEQVYTLLFLY